ncbi:hypothetical protein TraAM80_08608 [Trypanosoma rangeli]|uniref:Uncharacterized protein n=1 Tax=Trypanosoma rangeli TaxID=5698 RepID=A0A422N005_TRYRA|nr:uncharacterized protein TraAM80_08608 [Trypanosoma rangeli]RNE98761.1 hypothetical protein TraAM80_08608 [Trypanosoma rangeli]|eukprot:RNE98761.1 hypothetical protein TraAM80_08608 [Trypanosoma rangeli]
MDREKHINVAASTCSSPVRAGSCWSVDSATLWNESFTFGATAAIEQESDDFSKCPSPISYRNAFEFPALRDLVMESTFDGTETSEAGFGQGTSPVLGMSQVLHARTETPTFLTVTDLRDTNISRTACEVAGNLFGDDASPTVTVEAAVNNFSCATPYSAPTGNSINANVPTLVVELAGTVPMQSRSLMTLQQHTTVPGTTTNTAASSANNATTSAVAAAAWAVGGVGIPYVDSGTPHTDGVISSRYPSANASCQTPSSFSRSCIACRTPVAVEQRLMHLSTKNPGVSQEGFFLFEGNRVVDSNSNSDSNNNTNTCRDHGTRSLAIGHNNEGGKKYPTSSSQTNTRNRPISKQLLFATTASTKAESMKEQYPIKVPRKSTNVYSTLQDKLKYVPYGTALPTNEPPKVDESFGMTGTENSNIALLHDADNIKLLDKNQLIPMFIQMFPCELRDRTIIVLNRVVEATCGPDIATVVAIEPRFETSFIAFIRTNNVWQLIHKLRCRVLMDRHGFWYAENMEQYLRLKEYCESVRRMPQQMRHFQTDGLPCMPLVVELSRSVNAASVTSPPALPPFDEVAPIATMERRRMKSRNRL